MNEIIEKMHLLNEQQLQEAGTPLIGIFYIINEEVYLDGDNPRFITNVEGGQKNYGRTHNRFWYQTLSKFSVVKDAIQRIDKGRQISWKYFPRGRVLCSENNTDFVVYCDKHISTSEQLKSKIRGEMNLPYNTIFETDGLHYKCHACEPMQFH